MNSLFIERMKDLLKEEFDDFINTFNFPNYRAININTKKISVNDFLKSNKYEISKIPYDSDSFYLEDNSLIGNGLMHTSGMFYIQDPGALSTVKSYTFKGDEKVLDLCASPGGKSFQIAKSLNKGFLISNEIDYKRSKVLYQNIERLGLDNVIITNSDSKKLSKVFNSFFDVILIDSPCSGEGMFRKNIEAINNWSIENVNLCSKRDKEILDDSIKMLKTDGILIYSTCTYSVEENEDIIRYILDKGFEIIPSNKVLDQYTKEGLIKGTRRFYPHISKGEGQFFCVLKKIVQTDYKRPKEKKLEKNKIFSDFLKKYTIIEDIEVLNIDNRLYYLPYNVDLMNINVISYGIYLGEIIKNRFEPSHQFFKVFNDKFKINLNLDISNKDLFKYLKGEELFYDLDNGFGVLTCLNVPLGGFKSVNGTLKNYYPKGLRITSKEIKYE